MADITEVCQNPAFIVFASQCPISFVQVILGMPANSNSTIASKEGLGKSESYTAGAPRNDYAFHLPTPVAIVVHTCLRTDQGLEAL